MRGLDMQNSRDSKDTSLNKAVDSYETEGLPITNDASPNDRPAAVSSMSTTIISTPSSVMPTASGVLMGAAVGLTVPAIATFVGFPAAPAAFFASVGTGLGAGGLGVTATIVVGAMALIALPALICAGIGGYLAYKDHKKAVKKISKLASQNKQNEDKLASDQHSSLIVEVIKLFNKQQANLEDIYNALLCVAYLKQCNVMFSVEAEADYQALLKVYRDTIVQTNNALKQQYEKIYNKIGQDQAIHECTTKMLTNLEKLSRLGYKEKNNQLIEEANFYKVALKSNRQAYENIKANGASPLPKKFKPHGMISKPISAKEVAKGLLSFLGGAGMVVGVATFIVALTNPVGWAFIGAVIATAVIAVAVGGVVAYAQHHMAKQQEKTINQLTVKSQELAEVDFKLKDMQLSHHQCVAQQASRQVTTLTMQMNKLQRQQEQSKPKTLATSAPSSLCLDDDQHEKAEHTLATSQFGLTHHHDVTLATNPADTKDKGEGDDTKESPDNSHHL